MAEYARTDTIDCLIPTENLRAALNALNALNAHDGGVSLTAAEAFERFGFDTDTTERGLALTYYDDLDGEQESPLKAVAHLVAPGSFIEWMGDEWKEFWRNDFDGEAMSTREGRIVYDVPVVAHT